jgi:hypothetical protein
MRRIVSALLSLALTASLAASASADNHMGMMGHRCNRGYHWVSGYKKRDGRFVKGYCARDRKR